MKLTYLTIITIIVFFLYVMKSCDPETQGAAIENATLKVSVSQCEEDNVKIEQAWIDDAEALVKCLDFLEPDEVRSIYPQ